MALLRSLLVVALISLVTAQPGDLTVADQEDGLAARVLHGEQGSIIVTVNGNHLLDHSNRPTDDDDDDKEHRGGTKKGRFDCGFSDGFDGGFNKGYELGKLARENLAALLARKSTYNDPEAVNATVTSSPVPSPTLVSGT